MRPNPTESSLTPARPRAVLYLRQSTHREESISLELQEHEGRVYAERQGYEIVAVEADPGISGRTFNRPAVQRVMQMIDDAQADVIVLWKWSRLSRKRLDWAVAADRVETAGGRIESATEPLDTSTSTGRLARGMLTEFAAFESERIGDTWKEAHARRIRNGLPANGKPRFGYIYKRETGFEPDPLTGPILTEVYRRYIGGESIYSLVAVLNAGPARPVTGYGHSTDGLWSDRTLRRVLDSGFAAGYIRSNGELLPGIQPPLITEDEWTQYRASRERRRVYRRVERSEYLLSGMVRCVCGSSMTAGQFGSGRVPKYRCKAAKEKRTHTGGYVVASFVETHVLDRVKKEQDRIREAIKEERSAMPKLRAVEDPGLKLRKAIIREKNEIDALGQRAVDLGMPSDSYQRLLEPRLERLKALEAETLQVTARGPQPSRPIVLFDVWERWEDLAVSERREMLRGLIDHVIVTPGRPRASFEVVFRN